MTLALRRLLPCLLCWLFAGALGAQTGFSTIVVFGDSLSDTGNIAHLTQAASAGLIRYPGDSPALGIDYTDGRFTDGKDTQTAARAYFGVWVEQLAASLPGKPAVTDALDGGTNYAYGDATTASGTTTVTEGPLSITLHNLGQQLADYLGQSPAPVPNAGTLYVFWGGANDIYKAVAAVPAGSDPTAAATAAATAAVGNESSYIQQLIARGATRFMVVNLPPLGGVPSYATSSTAAALNAGAAVFAQALPQALAQIKTASAAAGVTVTFYQPDVFTQFATAATSPISLGLSNITAAAQNITASPDTYLIWDGLHPTTTGHHIVAALAANLLTPLVAASTTLTAPSTAITGQAVTLSAKVSSSAASTVPTGLLSFFSGTNLIGSAALDATGTATASFTALGAVSPYSITAVYAGDTTFKPATSAVSTLAVLGSSIATTTSLATSNPTAATGSNVTFTATVTPAVATYGAATGTVTFLDGSTALGNGTLSNGVATFTTTSLAAGTHLITATYAGSGLFGSSSSAALTETLGTPGFAVTPSSNSLTVAAGSSGQVSYSAQPAFGFSGTVTGACGTLPAHITCSFSPAAASTANGAATLTLTLGTTGMASLAVPLRPGARAAVPISFALLFLPSLGGLLWRTKRRRSVPALLGLLLLGLTVGSLAGCGGGSNNAARGTYTVPVNFSASGATTQSVNLSLTVQ